MQLSALEVRQKLEALGPVCRTHGIAVTPQRKAVYRALLEDPLHPTPEQVCARVRRRLPKVSLATVYKNLEVLRRMGLASELSPLHQAVRYDANTAPHHHLVCIRCKKVLDLDAALVDAARLQPSQAMGFRIVDVQVHVHGLCPECQNR